MAAVAVVLTVLGLAGCAPSTSSSSKPGDTLTVAVSSDSSETLNPYASHRSPVEETRNAQIYEGLTKLDPDGKVVWDLAVGMTPNADLTEWTIKLRPNVKFTDGSAFTAKDVVASIDYIMDPAHTAAGIAYLADIDRSKVVAVNSTTVKVGMLHPYGPFRNIWTNPRLVMTKAGSVPAHPIGTGPFESTSFTPGQASTLTRFDGYWGARPKIATMKLLEFQTEQGQVNALQSGQVDIASGATPAIAKSLQGKSGIKVLVDKSTSALLVSFNTSVAPFNDPRVVQAMRLLMNRKQAVSNAFGGYAVVADDYQPTPECPAPGIPQRAPDVAQAKKLLAEAGQSHLAFQITTDAAVPGMSQLVQTFAEDAAAAGVAVSLNQVSTPQLLSKWGQWPSYIDYTGSPYQQIVSGSLLGSSVGNATHWDDKPFQALADQLFTTTDASDQCTLENKMHKIEYEDGASIIPAFVSVLLPYRSNVHGLARDVYGLPLNFLYEASLGS